MRRSAPLIALLLVAAVIGLRPWQSRRIAPSRQPKSAPVQLTAWFINVGQGDCTLLRTPNGQFILIDAGPPESVHHVLSFLRRQRVSELALVIASHPHSDHVGGIPYVLRAFRTRQYMDPAFPYPSHVYADVLQEVKRQRVRFITARRGVKLNVGGARLEVLWPEAEFVRGTESDANNNSTVVRVSVGEVSLLFTGDIQREAIERILSSRAEIHSQLLKVPHHGSADAITPGFLPRVRPEAAVIFCGILNRYGYPHRETMRLLKRTRCAIYRTDVNGTITAVADGRRIAISTERGRNETQKLQGIPRSNRGEPRGSLAG